MRAPDWTEGLADQIMKFLAELEREKAPGGYYPSKRGCTALGRKLSLGYSCYALRILYILDLWANLKPSYKKIWVENINSYQITKEDKIAQGLGNGVFVDPEIVSYFNGYSIDRIRIRTKETVRCLWTSEPKKRDKKRLGSLAKVILGDTKQAICTLSEVGKSCRLRCDAFPKTTNALRQYLLEMDWSNPWAAGGQAAIVSALIVREGAKTESLKTIESLIQTNYDIFSELVDKQTGAYFRGKTPEYGLLVNGAMKVISAIDWLGGPIHHPEKLIDTVLSRLPITDGCHLVDAVYVLYRCASQTTYRRAEIEVYLEEILPMIHAHQKPDGAFSYYLDSAQCHYHEMIINRGISESDIHGTLLLTWALAMIFSLTGTTKHQWNIIKP